MQGSGSPFRIDGGRIHKEQNSSFCLLFLKFIKLMFQCFQLSVLIRIVQIRCAIADQALELTIGTWHKRGLQSNHNDMSFFHVVRIGTVSTAEG